MYLYPHWVQINGSCHSCWLMPVSDTDLHSMNKDWAVDLYSLVLNDGSQWCFDLFNCFWILWRWKCVICSTDITETSGAHHLGVEKLLSPYEWNQRDGCLRPHLYCHKNLSVFRYLLLVCSRYSCLVFQHRCRFQLWPWRLKRHWRHLVAIETGSRVKFWILANAW